MNLLQSCKTTLKTLIVVLTICLFAFSPMAIASTDNMLDVISEEVHIKNEGFSVNHLGTVPHPLRIQAAIVSLPEGESGTIDSIDIIGPNNEREFGCENIDVVNGTDLIKLCGGYAYLKEGKTTYIASGSNFKPDVNTTFGIELEF